MHKLTADHKKEKKKYLLVNFSCQGLGDWEEKRQ